MTMSNLKDRLAVLVVSCDKYSDLWKPFFSLFWQFWPDCPFNVYLLSNKLGANIPRVTTLLTGEDISWSDNLRKCIEQLEEEYILLFIEDLFLYDFVDSQEVLAVLDRALENKANYVRLSALPKPDKKLDEIIGIVSEGTIYRSSVVLSVWRKAILLDLLKPGESAWDFERYGSERSDSYGAFYSTWENYFTVINGVIKGKWQRRAVEKLQQLGIEIDLAKRPVMALTETTVLFFKEQRSKLLNLFPPKYRKKIKNFVLRGKYNYEPKAVYKEMKVK